MPGCDGTGMAKRSYPSPRSGAAAGRSYPSTRSGAASERSYLVSEARGDGQEEQPHVQGAVAAWVQVGLEELSHIQGQEGRQ